VSTVEEGKETREVSLEMKNLANFDHLPSSLCWEGEGPIYYWDGQGVT